MSYSVCGMLRYVFNIFTREGYKIVCLYIVYIEYSANIPQYTANGPNFFPTRELSCGMWSTNIPQTYRKHTAYFVPLLDNLLSRHIACNEFCNTTRRA